MPNEIFKITSAGSVDDGKSTLLARLLLDTGSIFDDQLTKDFSPENLADLLDGLESERDQGITIDVAHRFFDSEKRRYQIADSPGHEQYTRNMATACAGSQALLLVLDATVGIKNQTRLHLEIALRLGIRKILFAINKIDLASFSERKFSLIAAEIDQHLSSRANHFEGVDYTIIPVSGLKGHNVVTKSKRLEWFRGPTLLEAMDAIQIPKPTADEGRLPVQLVQRIHGGGRRYLGTVIDGSLQIGQSVFVGKNKTEIRDIYLSGQKTKQAEPGDAVAIELTNDLDIETGSIISATELESNLQFEGDIIWLSEKECIKGRRYPLKSLSASTNCSITKISEIDLDTDSKTGLRDNLGSNEIGRVNLSLSSSVSMTAFGSNHSLGRFILIDPMDGQTVAVGTINFPLRRSQNITQHSFSVTTSDHSALTNNIPRVLWLSGLSGSGKSTIADQISAELFGRGKPHYILDGDNLRFGLNRDLGFTEADRTENIRRTAEIAKLMVDAGLIVLVTLISPLEADRLMAKEIIGEENFLLLYVDTPIEVCESRDPKGLYARARAGEIPNFTGITAAFEQPGESNWKLSDFDDSSELVQTISNQLASKQDTT